MLINAFSAQIFTSKLQTFNYCKFMQHVQNLTFNFLLKEMHSFSLISSFNKQLISVIVCLAPLFTWYLLARAGLIIAEKSLSIKVPTFLGTSALDSSSLWTRD